MITEHEKGARPYAKATPFDIQINKARAAIKRRDSCELLTQTEVL